MFRNLSIALIGLGTILGSSTHALAAEVPSRPSQGFVDATGVQTHMNWKDGLWDTQFPAWGPKLCALHTQKSRSVFGTNVQSREQLTALNQMCGMTASSTVSTVNSNCTFDLVKAKQNIDAIAANLAGMIFSIEGPNEYTNGCKTTGWPQRLRDFQAWLYNTVRADPRLANVIVAAPSTYRRVVADYQAVGDISGSVDVATLHYYNNNKKPTQYSRDGKPGTMDQAIADARIMAPGKKVAVTETGYHITTGVTVEAAVKYLPRLVAEFLRRDTIAWINVYSLISDIGTNNYGLLNNDITERAHYFALQRLLGRLADVNANWTATWLDITFTGTMTDINYDLRQRVDGSYQLLIWNDAVSYNVSTKKLNSIPLRQISISVLGAWQAQTYNPQTNVETNVPESINATRTIVPLGIPDEVLIVELTAQ